MKKNCIKIIIGIIGILGLLSLTFLMNPKEEIEEKPESILANAKKESSNIKENEKKDFTEINIDTYIEYYSNEDSKIILIGRSGCPYCQIAEPILKNISYQHNITIYYLNSDNFTQEDETKLLESNDFFNSEWGTPLLMIVGSNSLIDKVDGLTDTAHYNDFLKRNHFI